ncbi:MAG: aminopeptidase P N-terminal domain-containing protein [Saprospirales bacterium]|nr:aminopeptidase P N-terminal domain-containing protein [Saprospirales bacterium]
MKYLPIDSELFKNNRQRFMRSMRQDSIAIFHSSDRMVRNGDSLYPFRQNSDLFALSGLDQEETVVVLFPDCVKEGFREVAFIKKTNDFIKRWEGHKYTKEEARAISGIDKIYWLEEMDVILHELILLAKRIYVNLPEHDRFIPDVPSRDLRFTRQLQERYPAHKFHRAQPLLKKQAMIKSIPEIALIRQAIDITDKAFQRVLHFVKPGVAEYEIEAEITHEFLCNRANGHAYAPIIASGANSCVLHYVENNQPCKDGEVLLLDFGAEYANYAADMTRTIPVNGQFSPRQRAVYDAVLRVLKYARTLLVPGTLLEDYHKEVGSQMESELLELGLLDKTDVKNQDKNYPAYKKYFMHGTSHHLGLDVHDRSNRYDPIQAGMVFSCEPAIYIPEEGFGIRLENDILVTDHEPVDLMAQIPIEAEEIEALIKARELV